MLFWHTSASSIIRHFVSQKSAGKARIPTTEFLESSKGSVAKRFKNSIQVSSVLRVLELPSTFAFFQKLFETEKNSFHHEYIQRSFFPNKHFPLIYFDSELMPMFQLISVQFLLSLIFLNESFPWIP